jgi:NAD(P)-dependent dehydrogenase (short-subunit alcohol dehydrogenase family)
MSSPVWLITGASNGFGLEMCLRVRRAGHTVIGSVRSKTKAATAVEQIEQAGGSVIELDMTESQASIASKIHALGRIDHLINVAGYSILAACEDITYVAANMTLEKR